MTARVPCWRATDLPHGVGHNAVCVCNCPTCVRERAEEAAPMQEDLFGPPRARLPAALAETVP